MSDGFVVYLVCWGTVIQYWTNSVDMTRDKGACHIKPIGFRAFKVAFCDLEACSSARAGRGNKKRTLAVHPVNTMYARYFAEMLGVMGDYGQPKMTSRV